MTDGRHDGDDTSSSAWPGLMVRAQDGDQAAYGRLLKALVPVVRGMARRKIFDDEALVEDVVQDVLLTIHRVRHTYDPARPFLPWLSAIVAARAIDALRARGRRAGWEVCDEEAVLAHPDGAGADTQGAARQQLDKLPSRLPERQRRIVELVHLSDMSLAEAAAAGSTTLAAVKSLLHRAFQTLRRHGDTDYG